MSEEEGENHRFNFINDWPVRRFVMLGLFTIALLMVFMTAQIYIDDTTLIELVGYLLIPLIIFVPGAALLRVWRVHGLSFTRATIYSLALSMFFIMVLGGALNLLHFTGIDDRPFNIELVNMAFVLSVAILTVIAYRRDREFVPVVSDMPIDLRTIMACVLAALLPLIVVIGTVVADFDGDRSIILYSLIAICLVPLILLCKSTKRYELVIYSLSLALILHRGLMTDYLMGYDVFSEYKVAYASTVNGFWDFTISNGAYTSMSSGTLAPMLTYLTSIGTIEMLKVVYPIIFAFVPLAIYKVIQSQFGPRAAMLGSFIFIGYQAYFALMIQLTKQQTAEVFLAVLLLVITDAALSRNKKRALVLVSMAGIIVSHYAIAYLTIGMLAGMVFFQVIWFAWDSWKEGRASPSRPRLGRWFKQAVVGWYRDQRKERVLTVGMAIAFVAFFLIWYSIAGSGNQLHYATNSGDYISSGSSGYWDLSKLDALEFVLIDYGSGLHNLEKYLVVAAQAICSIGVLYAMSKWRENKDPEKCQDIVLFGLVAILLTIAGYFVPGLSATFYFGRYFHFMFIFLSGFFALGVYGIVSYFRGKKVVHPDLRLKLSKDRIAMVGSVAFVVLFLLLNTGVLYHLDGKYDNSFALNSSVSWSIYSDEDVMGAKWVANDYYNGDSQVYADWHRIPIFIGLGVSVAKLKYSWTEQQTDSLIYLSSWNAEYYYVYSYNVNGSQILTYSSLEDLLSQVNDTVDVVYSTGGGTTVLYVPSTSDVSTNNPGAPINTYQDAPIYVMAGAGMVVLATLVVFGLYRRRR